MMSQFLPEEVNDIQVMGMWLKERDAWGYVVSNVMLGDRFVVMFDRVCAPAITMKFTFMGEHINQAAKLLEKERNS